jgi:hypothetical protein
MPANLLFPSDVLAERFADLWELAEQYKPGYEQEHGVALRLNVASLYLTVVSTYDDIARYKSYHLADPHRDRSDAIKRAAYLTKWIVRFKPWAIERNQTTTEDVARASQDGADLINELFAISVAILHLNEMSDKDFFLSPEKYHEVVYDLVYRTLSDDALMLFYQTLIDLVTPDRNIIEIQ